MSTQRHACTRRRMFEYRSQHIIPTSTYIFFSPRAQFAAVLYCDERQMSKSRESAQEREREKRRSQSVLMVNRLWMIMTLNDSEGFPSKNIFFHVPLVIISSRAALVDFFSWLPRCGRTRRRRRGRVYSAPMSSLFYYRL